MESLDSALLFDSIDCLQETISFDFPTPAQRQLILESVIEDYKLTCTADPAHIASKCHGYVLGDIAALCSEAVGTAMMRVPEDNNGTAR